MTCRIEASTQEVELFQLLGYLGVPMATYMAGGVNAASFGNDVMYNDKFDKLQDLQLFVNYYVLMMFKRHNDLLFNEGCTKSILCVSEDVWIVSYIDDLSITDCPDTNSGGTQVFIADNGGGNWVISFNNLRYDPLNIFALDSPDVVMQQAIDDGCKYVGLEIYWKTLAFTKTIWFEAANINSLTWAAYNSPFIIDFNVSVNDFSCDDKLALPTQAFMEDFLATIPSGQATIFRVYCANEVSQDVWCHSQKGMGNYMDQTLLTCMEKYFACEGIDVTGAIQGMGMRELGSKYGIGTMVIEGDSPCADDRFIID